MNKAALCPLCGQPVFLMDRRMEYHRVIDNFSECPGSGRTEEGAILSHAEAAARQAAKAVAQMEEAARQLAASTISLIRIKRGVHADTRRQQ